MDFRVLGSLQIVREGAPVELPAAKLRVLLAVLLCQAGKPVSVAGLVDELWAGRPPLTARKTLQAYVHRLRRSLGEDRRIVSGPAGYTITVRPGELDSERFREALSGARECRRRGDLERATELIRSALSLWRGEPFADIRGGSFISDEVARLGEQRLLAIEERIEIDLEHGSAVELVPELERLVAAHPFRERLRAALMRASYASGQAVRALEVYREGYARLRDELGVEPGPELRRLHEAVLRHELAGAAGRPVRTPVVALPPDTADFIGRPDELAVLQERLGADRAPATALPVVAISGPPGIGKTTLAVHAAHRLRPAFPDGALFVDLGHTQTRPLPPRDALGRLLTALTSQVRQPALGLDELTERYRLALAGRRVLVVLDDAGGLEQLLPLLPGEPGCGVIVTSRAHLAGLAGATRIDVGALASPAALRLLAKIVGADRLAAEPTAAQDLVRLCDGVPLAVRIAGTRLANRAHWRVATLVRRMADEHQRLDELVVGRLAIRTTLAASYLRLTPLARRAFRIVGLLDPPDVEARSVAALLSIPPDAAEELIEQLVDARLVEVVAPGGEPVRYRMPDLVRIYAREQQAESDQDRADTMAPPARNRSHAPS
jgi:DNA-binding SARP family transcriptional activator